MTHFEIRERVIKKAHQSNGRYKIGAIGLDKYGNVLGTSFNKPRFDRRGGGIHSEMQLMKKFGQKIKTIIICRVGDKNLLPIDPCEVCKRKADELGIIINSII